MEFLLYLSDIFVSNLMENITEDVIENPHRN